MLKVKAHGIVRRISGWIGDWLQGRQLSVVLNGSYFEWADVVIEMPQGFVLGLILFIVYTNDIDKYIASKVLKFPDDAKVLNSVSIKDDINKLRSDLVLLRK